MSGDTKTPSQELSEIQHGSRSQDQPDFRRRVFTAVSAKLKGSENWHQWSKEIRVGLFYLGVEVEPFSPNESESEGNAAVWKAVSSETQLRISQEIFEQLEPQVRNKYLAYTDTHKDAMTNTFNFLDFLGKEYHVSDADDLFNYASQWSELRTKEAAREYWSKARLIKEKYSSDQILAAFGLYEIHHESPDLKKELQNHPNFVLDCDVIEKLHLKLLQSRQDDVANLDHERMVNSVTRTKQRFVKGKGFARKKIDPKDAVCYNCNKKGHFKRDCPMSNKDQE
jgi:Zinc knuckle